MVGAQTLMWPLCFGGQMTAAKRAQMLGAAHAEDLTLLDSQLARQLAAWRRKRRLPAAPPLQHACTGRCTYRCALACLHACMHCLKPLGLNYTL